MVANIYLFRNLVVSGKIKEYDIGIKTKMPGFMKPGKEGRETGFEPATP